MTPFANKRVLIIGGTGSLGRALTATIVNGGKPASVTVFSRDEEKQWRMALDHKHNPLVRFVLGDMRDYYSVEHVLRGIDIVIHAAAMKQIPACEIQPDEAILSNVGGAQNLVHAIARNDLPIETVVAVSTDKACKPVNVYGECKALQERIIIQGNVERPTTRFICVRYGNVMSSRGSVIPLFQQQVRDGGPVTVTDPRMTRFLLSLREAAETIFIAVARAGPGEIFVPCLPSARMTDIAAALIGDRPVKVEVTGIRPGEKLHEILVSEEECPRTVVRGRYYVIQPYGQPLPDRPALKVELSSADNLLTREKLAGLLVEYHLS